MIFMKRENRRPDGRTVEIAPGVYTTHERLTYDEMQILMSYENGPDCWGYGSSYRYEDMYDRRT